MAIGDVFPRRNLPGAAEQWGRAIEDRVAEMETCSEALEQKVRGDGQTTSAALDLVGEQVYRIAARSGVFNTLSGRVQVPEDSLIYDVWQAAGSLEVIGPEWASGGVIYSLDGWGEISGQSFPYGFPRAGGDVTVTIRPEGFNSTEEQNGTCLMYVYQGQTSGTFFPLSQAFSGNRFSIDFWLYRDVEHAIFGFDFDWPVLIQWF